MRRALRPHPDLLADFESFLPPALLRRCQCADNSADDELGECNMDDTSSMASPSAAHACL